MSSITVGELKTILENVPEDYEVIMYIHHKHDIPKDSGEKGWIAYINGVSIDSQHMEVKFLN